MHPAGAGSFGVPPRCYARLPRSVARGTSQGSAAGGRIRRCQDTTRRWQGDCWAYWCANVGPSNGPIRRSRSTKRRASHAGIHGHPAPGQPPRQPRASEQRTRSGPTHPIRRGAMPTDRVYRHRQQAQTRKRAVNAGTTRPPQARRSSTRSGLNATPQNPGLHNVSVTWARQVVALTLSCAAGPDTWSMGTPAHTPPIGLTCASKGPSTHPSGRTCHPTAGRSRGPQHVLQPHIGRDTLNTRHLRTPLAQSAVHLSYNSPFSPVLTEADDGLSSNPKLRPS